MFDLTYRPRRLRTSQGMRDLVRETSLDVSDLIYPLFIVPGTGVREEISSLPGQYHLSVDEAVKVAQEAYDLGIRGVEIFGIPTYKDERGSSAWDLAEPVQQAIKAIRQAVPDLLVVSDVCLCQFTSTGHCGMIDEHEILNDETLPLLCQVAVSHAQAGAHMVAPSDMMDGRVGAIREALDAVGFKNVSIMSYAAKYASAYYGPFRDAVHSAPKFGDRKSYQMDPGNRLEAMREIELDIVEGADIIMIKPALCYLDIVREARDQYNMPLAVYNVSGEYAMVKTAAAQGLIDEQRLVLETMMSFKRAGAKIIITYHAMDIARWLKA
ncbi:MAG: porphobilinogen synthase [Veillonella sp.]|jgi:porphobilinogen synthase|uniref:porphobilinogen synthase n=1 Tax=Veillonella sp. TaxID=1926307 RepID=UPI001B4A6A3A|nr:porphobilinogen synthase [Veillonella sp.]MBK7920829.1 porphobilinogen synthase [Veillonella sp.]MBP8617109.1 porphobilinogen synthase [Veillonella sp.]MBP9550414.1 porphobilinogen synthase [Veillonella sp.]